MTTEDRATVIASATIVPGGSIMTLEHARWRTGAIAAAALALALVAAAAEAAVHVANNGLDSPTCGAPSDPCRTISQALVNIPVTPPRLAKILVHPGRYGDLDHDGVLNGPGEETSGVGTDCDCLIRVSKPGITIESTDGAAVTVLDASGGAEIQDGKLTVVHVAASGVVFGRPHHGFTLVGGTGLHVAAAKVDSVQIGGNLAYANRFFGFSISGGSNHVLTGNLAIANAGPGFVLSGDHVHVADNLAANNVGQGFLILASDHFTVDGNVASGNAQDGFAFFGTGHTIMRNVAAGNGRDGMVVIGSGHFVTLNEVVGNVRIGVSLGSGLPGDPPTLATVQRNRLYGNNPALKDGFFNCGFANLNLGGPPVDATSNYWGQPTGPGPEPADDVCAPGGGTTLVDPFSRALHLVVPPPSW